MKQPLSIHGRLFLSALVTTLMAMGIAGWLLQRDIVHVIAENLSAKIDTQVLMLDRGVAPDGRLTLARTQFLIDFTIPDARWGWRVRTATGQWMGGEAFGPVQRWEDFLEVRDGVVNGRATAIDGEPLYARVLSRGDRIIEVAVPLERFNETLRPAMRTMLGALAALAAVLIGATLLQLRYGLQPLEKLRRELTGVREGTVQSVTEAQPGELKPLAEEVNALLHQNAAGLAHARNHVANLAHGLKTPLATLALTLGRDGEQARTKALDLVADLNGRIDHHLGRARAAAVGAGKRAHADATDVATILFSAMQHLYADKALELTSTLPVALPIGVDRQDLDEMLGNLLDNACRHARSRVRLSSTRREAYIYLSAEDDGPGISSQALVDATKAGTRLDQSGRGYGFGLGIVRELSELYGGSLTLGRSDELGGLNAVLALPLR